MHFTKVSIAALPTPGAGKRDRHHDDITRGLIVKVFATGKRAFYHYRWAQGKPSEVKLGDFPETTIEQARRAAERMNGDIAAGANPVADREAVRSEWTFEQLFEWYMVHHARPRKKTWREDEKIAARYLGPWRALRPSAITRATVRDLHTSIGTDNGPYAANRTLALVRSVFNRATAYDKFDGHNPAIGVQAFKERKRSRRLTAAEFPAFFAAVDAEPSEDIRDYVLLSLMTGARKANMLAMRWAEIDWDAAEWHLPGAKMKNDDDLVLPLEGQEMAILTRRRKKIAGEWVFPGRPGSKTGHMNNPMRGWLRILERADIENCRLHDLRRTIASLMLRGGAKIEVIGHMLGHKSQAATMVYARMDVDPVRAAKRAALDAMGGTPA